MEILLIRENFTPDYTEGKLFINGVYICDTIEDCDRGLDDKMSEEEILKKKVYGKTCIPYGRYKVIIDYSNKYGKMLIHILNVKGFDGIRIHSLNSADSSLGCIGPGKRTAPGWVSKSRYHYEIIHEMVEEALNRGDEVHIEIKRSDEV